MTVGCRQEVESTDIRTSGVYPVVDVLAEGSGSSRVNVRLKVGGPVSPQAWIHRAAFLSWLPPYPASLAYALANVALWYAVVRELDRRGSYLKA